MQTLTGLHCGSFLALVYANFCFSQAFPSQVAFQHLPFLELLVSAEEFPQLHNTPKI